MYTIGITGEGEVFGNKTHKIQKKILTFSDKENILSLSSMKILKKQHILSREVKGLAR